VDAPDGEYDEAKWRSAPAFRWTPMAEWFPEPHAQLDIRQLGVFVLIDASEVLEIQAQIRERVQAVRSRLAPATAFAAFRS
jgi:hypothetical protein